MQRQDSFNWIASFIDLETRHLDLVASWEILVGIYESMKFLDSLTDSMRMEEFRWIIKETNKFLTRAKTAMQECVKRMDAQGCLDWLIAQYNQRDSNNVSERKQLVYQKLKQDWMAKTAAKLAMKIQEMEEEDA